MRKHPHLYEIHTVAFLQRMIGKYQKPLSLASIPDKEWENLASQGMDLVWLMGVWKRSPAARRQALKCPGLRRAYDMWLPKKWKEEDIVGSAYAIYDYSLEPRLGKENELALVRAKLNSLGLGLILDFVPNHLAFDHPWTVMHPERFIPAGKKVVQANPGNFFKTPKGLYLAHGRDPYFPAWSDTVQINYLSKEMREAMIQELLRIAEVSDGVRCDMAMLELNDVFQNLWGSYVDTKYRPAREFWSEAIERVRAQHPKFVFIAEVYWDMEWNLQQLGFDFTYDKRLYDRLMAAPPQDIKGHLCAEPVFQNRSLRFIENHDEPRSLEAFGRDKVKAAAIVATTIPGLRFFYDGQWEGRMIKLPVQFAREPVERVDTKMGAFYRRLLGFADSLVLHNGEWTLLDVNKTWEGDETHQNLLAWLWRYKKGLCLVVVNYSPAPSQGRIGFPEGLLKEKMTILKDHLSDETYERLTKEIKTDGLFVGLGPWGAHLLEMA